MNQQFNRGLFLTSLGSFWWGFIGVIYFEYVAFIGHVELVVHRCLWTAVMLVMTTLFFKKWKLFIKSISNKKNLFYLFISGSLIFINWAIWIYAVATERIIDASFVYFIMPIISVLLGYIFFKETLNKKRIISIILVGISIILMIFFNLQSLPWVGLIVALSWAFYNLVRKKINIDTDIGLLIESKTIQLKFIAAVLIAVPHIIGAPHPHVFESNVPAELSAQFAVASLLTSVFFWMVLGAVSGHFYQNLLWHLS